MRKALWIVVMGVALATTATAQEPKAKGPVTLTAAEQKWMEIPNTKVQISTLWGDFAKGPHGVIAKFVPGEEHPLHSHGANLKMVVLSGNFMFGGEGERPKAYGPGSYVLVPANFKHTSGCDKSGPCVMFQEGDAAFDMKPVEAAKKAGGKK
jgi:quercetin dioxygenase-like cupin family protein